MYVPEVYICNIIVSQSVALSFYSLNVASNILIKHTRMLQQCGEILLVKIAIGSKLAN